MKIPARYLRLLFFACLALPIQAQETPSKTDRDLTCKYPVLEVPTLVTEGKTNRAMQDILLPAIAQLHALEKADGQQFYCARGNTESLVYLAAIAAGKPIRPTDKKSAIVVDYRFALALYYSGYIEVSRGNFDQAEQYLNEALDLSPMNAMFLNELGYTYIKQGHMQKALKTYQEAEKATEFSPEADKLDDLGRALRMQGYVYVELGDYDKAKALYQQCLKMNPKDRQAKAELDYIDQQLIRTRPPEKSGSGPQGRP
ncbi:tetratricopeptide repeat protein [Ruficoccus sp. ZRK36]|uniref:tetratricopeptide repeat protein n=1 Tax=Ruficoccus sp. ZRK36 TaxID=2866311 RepID=UPI001C737D76|nr:tetratricopeptide repeat protein [Ruficoccus sp. ZRK36]QYY36629.1 tetratricopeptide repeat protein [Ruficoccus sp. ZRK36]